MTRQVMQQAVDVAAAYPPVAIDVEKLKRVPAVAPEVGDQGMNRRSTTTLEIH